MFFVLGRSALCINDHRTQNQSLKQAPLAFYEKFPVWKSCHFGRHFKKRSHQTDRCIARTNRSTALPESAFLMQLAPVITHKGGQDALRVTSYLTTHVLRVGFCLTVPLHRNSNNIKFYNYFVYINIYNIQLHLQIYITIPEESQS